MKDFLFLGKPLQKGRSLPLLFVRVFIACMMLLHGGAKWMAFGELADNFPDPLGVSPVVSLVFSLCRSGVFCASFVRAVYPLVGSTFDF